MTVDTIELEEGIAAYIAAIEQAMGNEPLPTTAAARRRAFARRCRLFRMALPDGVEALDGHICAPGRELAYRLYRPAGPGPHPVVLYLHGGGWVCGDVETHESVTAALAAGSGAAVLSLHYRRPPENPFPAAFEDAQAALAWLAGEGAEQGLDPARLLVGGDSAGGNLAAALAIDARERGGPPLRGQLLIYPVVDSDLARPSYRADPDPLLTRAAMTYYLTSYLGADLDLDDWRALPIRCRDHTGLPPAYVLTAEHDPLRDEGLDYAARLEAAGVPTRLRRAPGAIHGFLRAQPVSALARAEMAALGRAAADLLA